MLSRLSIRAKITAVVAILLFAMAGMAEVIASAEAISKLRVSIFI